MSRGTRKRPPFREYLAWICTHYCTTEWSKEERSNTSAYHSDAKDMAWNRKAKSKNVVALASTLLNFSQIWRKWSLLGSHFGKHPWSFPACVPLVRHSEGNAYVCEKTLGRHDQSRSLPLLGFCFCPLSVFSQILIDNNQSFYKQFQHEVHPICYPCPCCHR